MQQRASIGKVGSNKIGSEQGVDHGQELSLFAGDYREIADHRRERIGTSGVPVAQQSETEAMDTVGERLILASRSPVWVDQTALG